MQQAMEAPELLRCPISMELMEDPVTIVTGVTYERKNIEKWLFKYKKTTCPATMQNLQNFDLTPNHTLRSLISSLLQSHATTLQTKPSTSATNVTSLSGMMDHENLVSILGTIEASPFKVSSLRKLKSILERNNDLTKSFVDLGGIETLSQIMHQALSDSTDFAAFQACEEAIGVLSLVPLADKETVEIVINLECMKKMLQIMLHRGSAEARINTISVLLKVSTINHKWMNDTVFESDIVIIQSLLELLSDDFATKLSSSALDLLLQISASSAKNRVKIIESGAVSVLIELLPDSNRHICEKALLVLKRLCELPEGRLAFADHRLGIASVSKKILRVSELATKIGVKIFWLMCSHYSTERVLDDMLAVGAVRKLLALLHNRDSSSTKYKAIKIIKLHCSFWRQYPCFPSELHEFLRLGHHSRNS